MSARTYAFPVLSHLFRFAPGVNACVGHHLLGQAPCFATHIDARTSGYNRAARATCQHHGHWFHWPRALHERRHLGPWNDSRRPFHTSLSGRVIRRDNLSRSVLSLAKSAPTCPRKNRDMFLTLAASRFYDYWNAKRFQTFGYTKCSIACRPYCKHKRRNGALPLCEDPAVEAKAKFNYGGMQKRLVPIPGVVQRTGTKTNNAQNDLYFCPPRFTKCKHSRRVISLLLRHSSDIQYPSASSGQMFGIAYAYVYV